MATALVQNAGTTFHYEVAGDGPPVVLLHGGFLDLRQWDDLFPLLARRYRVLRFDARGHGRTPLGAVPYARFEDVRAMLDVAEMEAAHVVSLSAGSGAAVELALAYPARVASLALGAAPLRGFAVAAEFTDGMRRIVAAGVAGDRRRLHEHVWAFECFRVARDIPSARERLEQMVVEEHGFGYARPDAPPLSWYEPPAATALDGIRAPTLVVVGEGEMPALAEVAAHVGSTIPGARTAVVAGAGHFVVLEQPAAYARLIVDWLEEQAG
ncbi:MAG TPA: alpha/beta fold hydrolase [Gaiellaceae bacterium]|nr:alpha/beta fold hydrolase [Gaiellaceae bacterium]